MCQSTCLVPFWGADSLFTNLDNTGVEYPDPICSVEEKPIREQSET